MHQDCEKSEKFCLADELLVHAIDKANVTVPICVRADADIKEVKIHCIGEPIVTKMPQPRECKCEESCKFTVSQRLCVDVPIVFKAEVEVGESCTECEMPHEHHDYTCECECE